MPTISVKLSDSDAALLEQLTADGTSKSDAIRSLLRGNTNVINGNNAFDNEVFETLRSQLEIKDEQIRALNDALRASQMLQAAEKPTQLLTEPEPKRSWFERVKSAFTT